MLECVVTQCSAAMNNVPQDVMCHGTYVPEIVCLRKVIYRSVQIYQTDRLRPQVVSYSVLSFFLLHISNVLTVISETQPCISRDTYGNF